MVIRYQFLEKLTRIKFRGIECSLHRSRALLSNFNISSIDINVTTMSASSPQTQGSSGCHLVCLQRSHEDIPLPDGVTVNIGRSPATKIIDARCSRNQVALTSVWSERKVKVQQLGSNSSTVDGAEIGLKNEVDVGEGATIFILAGQFPHKVVFGQNEGQGNHKKVKGKTSKEDSNQSLDNRQSRSSLDAKQENEAGNRHSRKSLDIKKEKDDVKKIAKKRSSSENEVPVSKRAKQQHDQGSYNENDKNDSSVKDQHKEKHKSNESEMEVRVEEGESSPDEETHMKLMASKLESMKKKIDKDKVKETSSKYNSKLQNKTSSNSSPSSGINPAKKSSSSSSSSSTNSVAKENSWAQHEHLFVFTSKGVESRDKIAGFDVDGTIILTKSGKTFPVDSHDWRIAFPEIFGKLKQLHREGFKLVFFTNQLGVARGKIRIEDLKTKLENIVSKLQVPVQVFVATHEGKYRKPVDGMWRKLKNQYNGGISIDSPSCVYIGDAAGRPADWEPKKKKDFSLSDRLFALNIGVDFYTPEEFFLQRKKAPFTMPKFDPRKLSSSAPLLPSGCQLTLEEKEVIVMVGLPASGKSHFVKHNLKAKGYVVVNRDTLGSWQKCVKVTKESLVNSSVVVDNTNLSPEERQRYVDCAKEAQVPCRCFLMSTTFEHCRHNEKFREMTDSSHAKINEMIFNQARSKFKEPSMSEGFSEIVKVNFVPKFSSSSSSMAADYKKFLLEK